MTAQSEPALRLLICELGRRLYQRNLVAATDGNISVRLDADRFLCTPSGVSKGYMSPESLVVADGRGGKVSGDGKVTSEFFTHLAAYEQRPEVQAVVHAHPPMATALTMAGLDMRAPLLPEVVMALGAVPCAPYATPGSREGADAIRDLILQCDAVLLDRHGAVTVGLNLLDAYYKMEKLEHAAQIVLMAQMIAEPRQLTQDAIDKVLAARAAYGAKGRIIPPVPQG